MLSHYEILGIGSDASDEEIQAAYDNLLKQCYANLRDPKTHNESVEKIKQIKQAHDFLLNAESRKKFDQDATRQEIEKSAPLSPWRRFFARCFDLTLFCAVFFLVYKYFANYVFFEDWMLALKFAIIGIVLYILLETAVTAVFASTLGKWMLSMKITADNGQKPAWKQLVRRNFTAVLFGSALYIPPFLFATMTIQYLKLKKAGNDGMTAWDRACGTAVGFAEVSGKRLLLLLPTLVLVIVSLVIAFR